MDYLMALEPSHIGQVKKNVEHQNKILSSQTNALDNCHTWVIPCLACYIKTLWCHHLNPRRLSTLSTLRRTWPQSKGTTWSRRSVSRIRITALQEAVPSCCRKQQTTPHTKIERHKRLIKCMA